VRLRRPVVVVLAFAVAYVGSHALYPATGFHYDLLHDLSHMKKTAIDFSVWSALVLVSYWLLDRLMGGKR